MKSLVPILLVGAAGVAGWYFFIREPDGRGDRALTPGDPLVGPCYNGVIPEVPVYVPGEDPAQVPAENFLNDIPSLICDAMHHGREVVNWLGEQWAAINGPGGAVSPGHAILGGAVPAVIGLHPEVPRVVGDVSRGVEYRLTGVPQGVRVNGRIIEPVIHVQELPERGEATVRRRMTEVRRRSIRLQERSLRRARRRGDYARVAEIEQQLEILRN